MSYVSPERKMLAKLLIEEHPGVPKDDPTVALELVEAFMSVMKKHLLKEGKLHIEGVGTLNIKKFSGTEKKRDGRTGIVYKVTPRNVLKLIVADGFKRIINSDRKKSEKLSQNLAEKAV